MADYFSGWISLFMIELNPGIERSGQKLIFTSGKSSRSGFVGIIVVGAIFAFVAVSESASRDLRAVAFLVILFASILLLSASRQWTVEIDLTTRRIRVLRHSFDRWTKTIVDCSFDACSALGTFESDNDGHLSYSVYVKLEGGTRHAIPIANSTFREAGRVASRLAAATGIPRLDIYRGPTYVTPDDTTSRRSS